MTQKVILSLDGGSLKGIMQLKILETLNKIIGDKCNIRKIFKEKFCEDLSKVCKLNKESISDNLSHFDQDGNYMEKVGGKDILDALYDNFWDKSSNDTSVSYINPITKNSYFIDLCNFLGGESVLNKGTNINIIGYTFFNVRDQIKNNAIEGKSLMDFIDVVGGVSIGSVIATALLLKDESGGYKYSMSDCIEMVKTLPEKLFEKNWMPFFQPVLKGDKVLEGFKDVFGKDSTFKDLVGDKKLFISSTNLDTCKNTIWTNLVDSKSWDENFKNDSSLKDIRYVDVSDVKLYDAVTSSSSYLMALPAHEVKYKLLGENETKDRTEADGCYINVTPHLDLLSTLSATGTKIQDIIMIGIGTGRCDFDGKHVASGSPYCYVKDILSDQNFTSGTSEARQDNTSRTIDNIIRANGGSSYLLDLPITENQYKNGFDTALIPQYIDLADKWCNDHMGEINELAQVLIDNAC